MNWEYLFMRLQRSFRVPFKLGACCDFTASRVKAMLECHWSKARVAFVLTFVVFIVLRWVFSVPVVIDDRDAYVIRVNTFRRPTLLKSFVEHYATCTEVEKLIVVWSDLDNRPPKLSSFDVSPDVVSKVVFELHDTNRITNRFKVLEPFQSEAVLSVDDDLLIPCSNLRTAYHVWKSNRYACVGFAPRLHAFNPVDGSPRYLNWQYTWWNGLYSMVLTKASFIHRDFLKEFMDSIPQQLLHYIDENRNCEDIAMGFVIASAAKTPPVWVKGTLYEMSNEGISSAASHYIHRSHCLTLLADTVDRSPWLVAWQKAEQLGLSDLWNMWLYDTKP